MASPVTVKPDAIDTRASGTEAELARLQAENRRLQAAFHEQRLDTLEQRLDARGDSPQAYGGLPVPLWVAPAIPVCRDGRHCPPPRPQTAKPIERPYQGCGTFGCTPTLTHAPWDAQQRHRAAPRSRDIADPSHTSLPRAAARRSASAHR
ncbi:MAG: hypothetical protein KIS79_02930 [Burkholderiales bacterium]|nr:hypothetical protein [Burkholderiales bacterium]